MLKPIEYTYSVVNRRYEDLSLESFVNGKSPDLIEFDIKVDNNAGLPAYVKKYGNVQAQFGDMNPESTAVSQIESQMNSSGDFYNGIEYPPTGSEIQFEPVIELNESVNPINEVNVSTDESLDDGINPLNPSFRTESTESIDSISQLMSNPTLDSEVEENTPGISIDIPELSNQPIINNTEDSSSILNTVNNSVINNSDVINDESSINSPNYSIMSNALEYKSNPISILNDLNPISSVAFNSEYNSTDMNSINPIQLESINKNSSILNKIGETPLINDSIDVLNNSSNVLNRSTSVTSKINPGLAKTNDSISSYIENIDVTRDKLTLKSSESMFSSSSNSNINEANNKTIESTSETFNTDNSESNNLKEVNMTEVSNNNESKSKNIDNNISRSQSMTYSNIDLSSLENKLKRIERLLTGPLDVKIIE